MSCRELLYELFAEGDASAYEGLFPLTVSAGVPCILGLSFVTTDGADYGTAQRNIELSLVAATSDVAADQQFSQLRKRVLYEGWTGSRTLLWEPGGCIVPRLDGGRYWSLYARVDALAGAPDWAIDLTWGLL